MNNIFCTNYVPILNIFSILYNYIGTVMCYWLNAEIRYVEDLQCNHGSNEKTKQQQTINDQL